MSEFEIVKMVREFYVANSQPIAENPSLPDEKRRELRIDLIKEEFEEYIEAESENDLVEIADALADMVYIICGTAFEYGIPLSDVFHEVHRSNMSKLGADGKPVYLENGKVTKGPNYKPPKIAEILKQID